MHPEEVHNQHTSAGGTERSPRGLTGEFGAPYGGFKREESMMLMKGCWFCETLAQSTPRPGIWEGARNTKKHSYPICWGRREGEWMWNQRLLAKGKRAGHTNFQAACWATLTLIQQHREQVVNPRVNVQPLWSIVLCYGHIVYILACLEEKEIECRRSASNLLE